MSTARVRLHKPSENQFVTTTKSSKRSSVFVSDASCVVAGSFSLLAVMTDPAERTDPHGAATLLIVGV